MEAETVGDTLCVAKAKPFANALATRLAEVKAIQLGKTLTNVNFALLL